MRSFISSPLLDGGYKIEDFDKINLMYIDIETDDRSGVIEYEGNGELKESKQRIAYYLSA